MVEYKVIKPEALKRAIKSSVFSIGGISRNSGISEPSLSNLKNGVTKKVRRDKLEALANILGVEPDEISEHGVCTQQEYVPCVYVRIGSIKQACKERHVKIQDIVPLTGRPYLHLHECDLNHRMIKVSTLKVISDYLGLPVTFFLPPEPEPEHLVVHKGSVCSLNYNDPIDMRRNKRGEPKKCHGCRYRGWAGTDSVCDYINIAKRKRGCTVAACSKYEPKKPKEKYNSSDKMGDKE